MPAWLSVLLSILQAIYTVESPTIKTLLLQELQNLAAKYPNNPVIDFAITEAEALVAALPTSV